MIITIDGPTASGKSTTAQNLAEKLNFFYLNSGLLFRGLAYAVLQVSGEFKRQPHDTNAVDLLELLPKLRYSYDISNGAKIFFNEIDITTSLKKPEISTLASILGMNARVRSELSNWQRQIVGQKNAVVEGRDAGSVVFSGASLKIFLTADINIRAKRFQQEQETLGEKIDLKTAINIVSARDERDSKRHIAPLLIPNGAQIIDNSSLNQQQTIQEAIKLHKSLYSAHF